MQLIPVPTTPEYLNATFHLWSPFLPRIAHYSGCSLEQVLGKLARHEVQPVLVLDEKSAPIALIGVSIADDAGRRVGEIVWLTFTDQYDWRPARGHVLSELERYLREHVKCERCRALCRPGWQRFLERQGYRYMRATGDKQPHVIMEKVL